MLAAGQPPPGLRHRGRRGEPLPGGRRLRGERGPGLGRSHRHGRGADALAIGRGQVFAAGSGTNAAGNRDFLIRAYQAKTGVLLWEDQCDQAGLNDAAVALAAGGGQVVAGGMATNASGNFDVLIRAYKVQ
jgi:outer membrane protein assembly factor BamB